MAASLQSSHLRTGIHSITVRESLAPACSISTSLSSKINESDTFRGPRITSSSGGCFHNVHSKEKKGSGLNFEASPDLGKCYWSSRLLLRSSAFSDFSSRRQSWSCLFEFDKHREYRALIRRSGNRELFWVGSAFGKFEEGFGFRRHGVPEKLSAADYALGCPSPGRGFGRTFGGKIVVLRAAAGASSGALSPSPPPEGFRYWWSTFWAVFTAWCASCAAQLQRIRIGPIDWLDIVTMIRIVIIATGALAAYMASKRAWKMVREHAAGGQGGSGGGGPMQVLARGATCLQSNMGPWSVSDLALGLTAMAKVTEKEPPPLPGQEVKDLAKDSKFLLKAQHYRALSEAVYVKDSASFSLLSNLPESSLIAASWEPCQDSFRPAYAVFVDAPYGAVVLAVRGTSHVIDMLLNSGTSPESFGNGYAHGGFVHATEVLHGEVLPHIEKAFRDHGRSQDGLKLVIVGHSMGAAVGSLMGLKLREKFSDLECWCYCPPASMSLDLARECKSFTTSFVAGHDLVPRFSLQSVEKLRSRIQEFDWDEAERVAKDDEDWQNIKKVVESLRGFQRYQDDAKDMVKKHAGEGSAVRNSETAQTAKDLGKDAWNSEAARKVQKLGEQAWDGEAGGKVRSLGQQAKEFINGEATDDDSEKQQSEEADKPPPALHPPGRLLVLGCDPPGCGKKPEQRSGVASERSYGTYPSFDEARDVSWIMHQADQEELEDIVVSPWCISDHMLGNMCEAIGYFQSQCPPVFAH